MRPVGACDVVAVAGIDEVVELLAVVDAVLDEDEAVLPHHHIVGGAVDHQELAFQLVGLVLEAGELVTLGVLLGRVHVTLAVHDLIVFPIQHRTARHADLEHLGVVDLQRGRHEAAIAPAVAADAVGVDIRQGLQPVDAHHLVAHLELAALTMDALLEGLATVGGATVVEGEDEEAFLGEVVEVDARAGRPLVGDELGVGTAIHVDDDGIFLRSVEVIGLDETGVERLAVFGLQGAQGGLAEVVVLQRVLGLVQTSDHLAVAVLQVDVIRHIGAAVVVEEILAVARRHDVVRAVFLGELGHLAALDVHHVAVALQRADLGGTVVDLAAVLREAVEVGDDEVAMGELLHLFLADGIEIEVIVAVALGLPDELVGVVGQEVGGTLGLHILVVAVLEDGLDIVARDGVVFVELQVVLLAVEDADVDAFVVGVPGDGGEVLLGGFAGLDYDLLARGDVVDVQRHLVARHARHGVFDGVGGGDTLGDVDERIVGHHALVHAVVGEELAVGRPEDAAVDGELIAVHALTGHHALRVVGDLDLLVAFGHIQVVFDGIGHVQGGLADILVGSARGKGGDGVDASLLDVHLVEVDAVVAQAVEIGLVFVDPRQLGDTFQFVDALAFGEAVQLVEGEEGGFFLAVGHHGDDLVVLHLHEDVGVADPFQLVGTLGVDGAVVVGSVGGGEHLLFLRLCRHNEGHRKGYR